MALAGDELEVLRRVVSSRNPGLLDAVDQLTEGQSLTEDKKAALQQTLLGEMYEKGLEKNDEPNEYGKQLDGIVGKLEGIED